MWVVALRLSTICDPMEGYASTKPNAALARAASALNTSRKALGSGRVRTRGRDRIEGRRGDDAERSLGPRQPFADASVLLLVPAPLPSCAISKRLVMLPLAQP
jgi:hypothetical protein